MPCSFFATVVRPHGKPWPCVFNIQKSIIDYSIVPLARVAATSKGACISELSRPTYFFHTQLARPFTNLCSIYPYTSDVFLFLILLSRALEALATQWMRGDVANDIVCGEGRVIVIETNYKNIGRTVTENCDPSWIVTFCTVSSMIVL